MVSVMDNRVTNMRDNPPKEVTSILETGEVDGIIGMMLFESMIGWMEASGLPHTVLYDCTQTNRVNFDYAPPQFFGASANLEQVLHVAKAGINYRF